MSREFVPPESMAEAKNREHEMVRTIMSLENKLGSQERKNYDGSEVPQAEYRDWRTRTAYKLSRTKIELTEVRRWIKDRRRQITLDEIPGEASHPVRLLAEARRFLKEHKNVLLDTGAGALQAAIDDYLIHEG